MPPVSLSRSLFGRNTCVSVQLGGIAVVVGLVSFSAGIVVSSIGRPGVYSLIAYGMFGCGLVLAAAHTDHNSGLLVSWLLLFWPTAGVFAYWAFAADMKRPRGKQPLLTEIVLSGYTRADSPLLSAEQ